MKRLLLGLIVFAVLFLSTQQVKAVPIFNPTNWHHYDAVVTATDWLSAKAAAESMFYMGYRGHLTTITSQQENNFLSDTFGTYAPEFWIGGFQPPGSPEPAGNWQWVTGEPFDYTNWYPEEPNDVGGNEPYLEIRIFLDSKWNDNDPSQQRAYLVEWDTPIPEPSTILLLTTGLIGIAAYGFRRRRRKRT